MYFSAENGVLMGAFPMIYHILPPTQIENLNEEISGSIMDFFPHLLARSFSLSKQIAPLWWALGQPIQHHL